MDEFAKLRKQAGISQNEAAVLARVSPPTARNFEKFGPRAVADEAKRARLQEVYSSFATGRKVA
jgi:transcriptional regulator with XRE-family HTH domain